MARLVERESALLKENAELRGREEKLNDNLKAEFEVIATKVLKTNSAELSETSKKQMDSILNPLRERIQDFQTRVENAYEAEKREVLSLKEQIRMMAETSQALSSQADGLAKALKGNIQTLGRWGELVLERILQTSGLMEGREYVTQGRGLNLKSESGASQKPDVIIRLPEDRTMIIDSKISLNAYDRLVNADNEEDRISYSEQLVRDVKNHIDDLSGKGYQENSQVNAHEAVLMFVPIEGALAAALTKDDDLFNYAWKKKIVLVGPPTLMMTLRTIASIWRYELQAQNAQQIADLAGSLCDKVSDSLEDLNVVTDRMNQALNAHNEAVKRLSTGRGNALRIGERIRGLGVKTKKPTPSMIIDGERVDPDAAWKDEDEDDFDATTNPPLPSTDSRE